MKDKVVTVGIDAHKRKCVAACLHGDSNVEMFEFQTTREGLTLLARKVPEKTTIVIEASTTGKVISRLLASRYDVHMVAPPERKPSIKTDERDAVRIAKEDSLGYLRRVYVPDEYIEGMRQAVARQVQIDREEDLQGEESGALPPAEEHGARAGRPLRPLRGGGPPQDG